MCQMQIQYMIKDGVCVFTCVYLRMYVCIHEEICTCMYIRMYTRMCNTMYARILLCAYASTFHFRLSSLCRQT